VIARGGWKALRNSRYSGRFGESATPKCKTLQHAPARRAENLKGGVSPSRMSAKITGRHVVIVDDVWTSGATMQAMARARSKPRQTRQPLGDRNRHRRSARGLRRVEK